MKKGRATGTTTPPSLWTSYCTMQSGWIVHELLYVQVMILSFVYLLCVIAFIFNGVFVL